jgi:hypothetical protein
MDAKYLVTMHKLWFAAETMNLLSFFFPQLINRARTRNDKCNLYHQLPWPQHSGVAIIASATL